MSFFTVDDRDVFLTLNGFNLYGEDKYGCEWHTTFSGTSGIFDGVGSTIATSDKAWSNGWYTNIPTYTGREISVEGYIYGSCPEYIVESWDYFKSQFLIGEQRLTVKLGSLSRWCTVMQASSNPLLEWEGPNLCHWSISLISADAYLYSTEQVSGSTYLPTSEGGMSFPYHFEPDTLWRFNENIDNGYVRLYNSGSASSPVTIRIDGPVTNPSVTHVQSGRTMSFNTELGRGHYILADGQTHSITVDGVTEQSIVTSREWPYAAVGSNSYRFSAEEYSSDARLTVSFYPAYI